MSDRMWKLKRSLNNIAFKMSLVKLTPGTSRPLLPVVSLVILGFSTFVLAGGLFLLVFPNVAYNGPGLTWVYPNDIHNQTPQEGVFAMVIYSLGLVGLYAMLMSTRNAYRPKRAYTLLTLSMVLVFVFIATGYFVLFQKLRLG